MVAPGKVVVDRRGEGKRIVDAPDLTLARVEDICKALANHTGVQFDPDTAPKLSCVIPEARHRFECLVGASVQTGISLAIRCKHPFTPTWEQVGVGPDLLGYLEETIMGERNLIVSGATNTGKTTLLNKLLEFLPDDRRVVAVEDTPELHIDRFWDGVGLVAAREASTSSGMVTWRELYDHQMRITPDHVIFGEISTQNAFAALGALNSGITGFSCTIHAESPLQVLKRKFVRNIAWAGERMSDIPEFLAELVDVIVQIKRDASGFRRITDVYEPRNDHWVMRNGELRLQRPHLLHTAQEDGR
ncbi:CpaF/VirB11 family protein [Oleispirillum naphthae]|uniref:CpaF/VirB11 family protein n=1 Tax=Oleispirillum naphthae TaxID=2838853 RepID=UPI00308257D1